MDLDRVVSELGIGESRELLELAWDASQDAMPEGEVGFLSPAFLREACRGVYLPEEITEAAVEAARRVGGNPALCALAWHCHWCLYRYENYPSRLADRWPSMEGVLGDADGLFYMLVLLSWFPHMEAVHRAHALPEPVVRESMDQIYQRACRAAGCSAGGGWTGMRPAGCPTTSGERFMPWADWYTSSGLSTIRSGFTATERRRW